MKPWQLSVAVLCGRVSRVEVLALRCCGYKVQVITRTGGLRTVEYAPGHALWPELALLKARLRRCAAAACVRCYGCKRKATMKSSADHTCLNLTQDSGWCSGDALSASAGCRTGWRCSAGCHLGGAAS